MQKYAKIIDEQTGLCSVGVGTDEEFYQSLGMTLQDVEQAYNGNWYLSGYAPKPSDVELAKKEITDLKNKLYETDYTVIKIAEGAATPEEYAEVIEHRGLWRARINELESVILNAE